MNYNVEVTYKHYHEVNMPLNSYPRLRKMKGTLVNHNCKQIFIENENGCLEMLDMALIVEMREVVKS